MPIEPLVEKWRAFNWEVFEINGHDMSQIVNTIEVAQEVLGKPTMIIAHTIKGKGISFMENQCDWHGKAPNKEEFEMAMNELGGV
jgi:transketolase